MTSPAAIVTPTHRHVSQSPRWTTIFDDKQGCKSSEHHEKRAPIWGLRFLTRRQEMTGSHPEDEDLAISPSYSQNIFLFLRSNRDAWCLQCSAVFQLMQASLHSSPYIDVQSGGFPPEVKRIQASTNLLIPLPRYNNILSGQFGGESIVSILANMLDGGTHRHITDAENLVWEGLDYATLDLRSE